MGAGGAFGKEQSKQGKQPLEEPMRRGVTASVREGVRGHSVLRVSESAKKRGVWRCGEDTRTGIHQVDRPKGVQFGLVTQKFAPLFYKIKVLFRAALLDVRRGASCEINPLREEVRLQPWRSAVSNACRKGPRRERFGGWRKKEG